jgi:GNAT superfamily N-acetyltransferase
LHVMTELFLTDSPTPDDIKVLSDGLFDFNVKALGSFDRTPLGVFVRDEVTNRIVGGLAGATSLGVLFVDWFYLPESLRGSGLGSGILQQAEEEAVRRGCRTGVLFTLSVQAPGFYVKQGWTQFGDIPSIPDGLSRRYFTKELG